MRFRLSTLIVILVVFGAASAWYAGAMRSTPLYRGYFAHDQWILKLIPRADPAVKVQGSGGGGGGGSGAPLIYKSTHSLTAGHPITEDLLKGIQRILLEEFSARGIKVLANKDLNGADSNYSAAGVRMITWGFQIVFEENGYKGVVSVRLMSKTIPGTESMGHLGELFDNIVVFPRD